jgi:PKD repeat protein
MTQQQQQQRRHMQAPRPRRLLDTILAAIAAAALAVSLGLSAVAPAAADSAPPVPADPANPATVTADGLPTVQIDGVVWQQVIVGNTVYAAGSFGTARPAGSPVGSNTVVRNNILAYNLTTGELLPFAPVLNAQALSIAASPDGSRIYVGGDFTSVNGATVWRVAALDPVTGALVTSFLPKVGATVRAIVPTAGTVYLGGLFTSVGSAARSRLAAVQASDGALTAWAPSADGRVNALALSPDGSRAVVGGAFTTLNGSSNPGYGLAAVDTVNGGLLPWAVNSRVRNGGLNSGITSLSGDADNVYATGYVFGAGGNLEGIVAASWNGGNIQWLDDCHGDTYAVFAAPDVVYKAGHAHYCGNIGGYPQTEPWNFQRALAYSKAATGTIIRDPLGYPNWSGLPAPSLLNWFPNLDTGSFTGQNQGPWAVTGNSKYVVMGGEFKTVNGVPQQGLVRFTVRDAAPNRRGPVLSGLRINPTLTSPAAGTVRVRWQANHDQDNVRLTYRVIRDGAIATPVSTVIQDSTFWKRPGMSYVDSGLVPGQTYRYRIFVTDPLGNEVRSDTVTITAATTTPSSGYADSVLADRPSNFWRFNDGPGTTLVDSAGAEDLTAASGAGLRADGAVTGESTGAGTFDGTANGVAVNNGILRGPDTFTAEAWVRTGTTSGGKIIGFGNVASGTSRVTDRNVYMDDAGRIYFGVWNGAVRTVNSGTGFNDGQWHHIVSSLSPGGMFLYIDGARAAFRTDVTTGRVFDGYWRIGSDLVGTWPSQPTSGSLQGDIDEVALYPAALGLQQVQSHYRASGRSLDVPATPPTAAFTSSITYLTVSADASGSSDPNGPIASYSWSFGDGSTGSGVTAQHVYAAPGPYTVRLTVVDADGSSASTTRTVTATAPPANQPPVAAFTSSTSQLTASVDASTSSDPDGTIVSYAWDFGDSATGTGRTAAHSYASGGSYQVTLTVTDNVGAVSTAVGQVTVVPNQPPAAEFTAAVTNLTAAFDARASADPDGTIASYAWDFGDSTGGTGATPSHTYAAAGTYQATLTVVDNNGAANSVTKPVTVTAPPPNSTLAADAFGRTTAAGWGTADTGGDWTVNGSGGNYSVGSGVGTMVMGTAGVSRLAFLPGVSTQAADIRVSVSADKIASGGGLFLGVVGRKVGTDEYRAKLKISATGSSSLYLTRVVGGTETTLQSANVAGLTVAAGDRLRLRMAVTGSSPAALQAKVWRDGAAEPAAWLVSAGDATASLQAPGSVGLMSFLWSTAGNAPVQAKFDDLDVRLN